MQHQIINVDSRFRDKGSKSTSDFLHRFSDRIKNVRSIRVSSLEFPNTYYTFTTARDNISFSLLSNDIPINITIREGSYTIDQILEEINNAFQTYNTLYGFSFLISYDEITSKSTISNGTIQFTIDFSNQPPYESLGYHLGFLNNIYSSLPDNTNVQHIVGETITNTVGDTYMYLKINNFGTTYSNIYCDRLAQEQILAKIIIKKNKGDYIYDNESNFISKYYEFMQPVNIDVLHIELLDPYGKTVNLMGQNFSMTLEIQVNIGNICNQHF